MFELQKKSAHVPANSLKTRDTFEFEGETYLVVEKPSHIGSTQLKMPANQLLCVSLNTLRMQIFSNEEVLRTSVKAVSEIRYED